MCLMILIIKFSIVKSKYCWGFILTASLYKSDPMNFEVIYVRIRGIW